MKGLQVSYECLSACTVRVHVAGFRDCSGSTFLLNWGSLDFSSATANCPAPLPIGNPSVLSTTDITPICPTASSNCNSPSAVINGIEMHEMYRDYDMCALPANCPYELAFASCCRNGSINALSNPASTSIRVQGPIYNTANPSCNNPPMFGAPSSLYFCQGEPFEIAMGAIDPDGDSLAYSLGPCWASQNQYVVYNLGYTANQPFGPSWNLSIDAQTGNLKLLPQPGNIVVGVVCVFVEEWRNGILQNTTMRDLMFTCIPCPNNDQPQFANFQNLSGGFPSGPNEISVCPGTTVSFDLPTNDPDGGQTQTMFWDQGINGAVFHQAGNPTVLDSFAANNPTGHFEFTPSASGIYNFVVQVQDNACPVLGITTKRIQIVALPLQTAQANLVSCTTAEFFAQGCGGTPPYTYQWSGQGGLSSTSPNFTHYYGALGSYAWECIITDANMVSDTFRDTLITSQGLSGPLITNPDTMLRCPTQPITIQATNGFASYLWSTGATTPSITIQADGQYAVTVTDSSFCSYSDSVLVLPAQPAYQSFLYASQDTLRPCMGIDSSILFPTVGAVSYDWSTGETMASIQVTQPGTFGLTVTDNFGCQLYDSVEIGITGADLYGTVTTSSSLPLASQKVYLIIYNSVAGTLTAVDSAQTTYSGFYSFCGINTIATYFVKAAPDSLYFPTEMPTYADSSLVWNNATPYFPASLGPIQVDFSTIFGSNPGGPGFIGGLVSQGANKTDGPGDPVEGLRIFLMDAATQSLIGFVNTDANGHFSFDNLPYGDYKVIPDKPNVDEQNVPVVSIDQSNPQADSLDFRLHSTYLELVVPTAINEPISGFSFEVFPNPIAQTGRISLELEQSGPVKIELYDMRGARMETVIEKDLDAGAHVFNWTPDLAPGAYFLRLQANAKEKIIKVILLE